jgi:hypothetical protein
VDLPMKHGDFPEQTVSLPEGISTNIPVFFVDETFIITIKSTIKSNLIPSNHH